MSKSTNYKNEKNINEFLKKNNLKDYLIEPIPQDASSR